jgi:hypothetical protein
MFQLRQKLIKLDALYGDSKFMGSLNPKRYPRPTAISEYPEKSQ